MLHSSRSLMLCWARRQRLQTCVRGCYLGQPHAPARHPAGLGLPAAGMPPQCGLRYRTGARSFTPSISHISRGAHQQLPGLAVCGRGVGQPHEQRSRAAGFAERERGRARTAQRARVAGVGRQARLEARRLLPQLRALRVRQPRLHRAPVGWGVRTGGARYAKPPYAAAPRAPRPPAAPSTARPPGWGVAQGECGMHSPRCWGVYCMVHRALVEAPGACTRAGAAGSQRRTAAACTGCVGAGAPRSRTRARH